MVNRDEIVNWMNEYLSADKFKDYCPNGLQVEGSETVSKIVCAVSSSFEAIQYASDIKADMLLVHHGLIWKGPWNTLTGIYRKKIKHALVNNLNIAAYHLPLDSHIEIGNAVALARRIGLKNFKTDFEMDGMTVGIQAENFQENEVLINAIKSEINPNSHFIIHRPIQKVGIITGGGHSEFESAIHKGCDTYITGENTEWIYHLAKEYDVNFISCGHHASEQFGVQDFAKKINETFSVKIEYHDLKNPF